MDKIIVVGDLHGNFGDLNKLIQNKKPDHVICCGDFGVWKRGEKGTLLEDIKIGNSHTKVWFCEGNHEDYNIIRTWGDSVAGLRPCPVEVKDQVFYCPRGTIQEIGGFSFLFMGGADSIDKAHRKAYVSWFPEEVATVDDFARIDLSAKVDCVISHTIPTYAVDHLFEHRQDKLIPGLGKIFDPTTKILDAIVEKVVIPQNVRRWYAGHWHLHEIVPHREGGHEWDLSILDHCQGTERWFMEIW